MKRQREAEELVEQVYPQFEPETLSKQTPHPRDAHITFDEAGHLYAVRYEADGPFVSTHITSVSTFIHQFFPDFDADSVLSKMRKGRNWATGPYVGMSNDDIKQFWAGNGKTASARGTWLHFLLECHNNGYPLFESIYADIPEIQDYRRWREKHFVGLVPFRTELRMYTGVDLRITGTADLLAIDDAHPPPEDCDGVLSLHLIDWKFSKAIRLTNQYENGSGACRDLPACNFSSYALQQNIYQWLLETYYGDWVWRGRPYTSARIVSKHLAVFHPNHDREGYYVELPDMRSHVCAMMDARRSDIACRVRLTTEAVDS
jgi:hypothetical protein